MKTFTSDDGQKWEEVGTIDDATWGNRMVIVPIQEPKWEVVTDVWAVSNKDLIRIEIVTGRTEEEEDQAQLKQLILKDVLESLPNKRDDESASLKHGGMVTAVENHGWNKAIDDMEQSARKRYQ